MFLSQPISNTGMPVAAMDGHQMPDVMPSSQEPIPVLSV
jgi:hypothetical protein